MLANRFVGLHDCSGGQEIFQTTLRFPSDRLWSTGTTFGPFSSSNSRSLKPLYNLRLSF